MMDILTFLKKGALVAQDPSSFETIEELDEDEKVSLRREVTHRWSQPRVLYLTITICSIGAAVQYVHYAYLSILSLVADMSPGVAGEGLGSDWFERCQLIFPCRVRYSPGSRNPRLRQEQLDCRSGERCSLHCRRIVVCSTSFISQRFLR